ncbi:MAG: hypothetical protein OCD76_21465 [Reichenbachiella sp.]
MKCPNCNTVVENQNINIHTDVAQCQNCNNIFKIAENINDNNYDGFDMNNPPNGTWIKKGMNQIVIGATTRSPVAFFLVPFMMVWIGGSIGGIYGTQIVSGEFDPIMSLFGIPFVIGSIMLLSGTLMTIIGEVRLTFNNHGGTVFTGIENIGLTKKFSWDEIARVREKESNLNYPGSQGGSILLEGSRRISFGLGVKESRRYYLFRTLETILSKVKVHERIV